MVLVEMEMAKDSNSGVVASGSDHRLLATVTFEYSSQQEGELSLAVGDVIKDVIKLDDIWCSGVIDGKRGIFPYNFVKLSKETSCISTSNEKPHGHGKLKHDRSRDTGTYALSSRSHQSTQIKDAKSSPMKAKEVSTSSLASAASTSGSATSTLQSSPILGGPMKKKKLGHSSNPYSRNIHTQSVTQQDTQMTPMTATQSSVAADPSTSKAQTIEKATVKVAYNAIDEDEISVCVGDVVDVISKVTEDEGWWKVRLGTQEGLIPEIFLEASATPDMTVLPSENIQEPTEWLTLVPLDNQTADTSTASTTGSQTQTTQMISWPDDQQVGVTQTANEIQSMINFPSELVGRALMINPNIASRIHLLAKQHNVTVSAMPDNLSQVVVSGSPPGVAFVHNEISTLASQAKRDIKAHCMVLPILFSQQAREMIAMVRQRYGIEISVVTTAGLFHPIHDVLIQANDQIQLLQKVQASTYLIPLVSISEPYTWSFINKLSALVPLPAYVNELLSNWYCLQINGQKQFQFDDRLYVADLSAMMLVDTTSGETVALHKEPQQPYWSFAPDQQRECLNFVQSESEAIEFMYRYGGSSIALSEVNHLIEFNSMHQLNLSTGKTSLIKRHPPPLSSVLPDYNCHLVLTGSPEGLSEITMEIMKQLDALCTRTEFTCKLPGISQHWQDVIAVHAFNVFRQFCVKVDTLQVNNGVLIAQLQGERDYCGKVKVHVKEQLLELLQYAMTQECSLRSSPSTKTVLPPEWEPQQIDVEFKSVRRGNQEWSDIEGMVHKTLPAARLVRIDRVQNLQLWEKYALEKRHMNRRNNGLVNEKLLFHGTRKNDPKSVVQSLRGIDFRCSRRDHQLLWGTGAYFAANANYSNRYSYYNTQFQAWQMIVVKVLTGNSCSYRNHNPSLTRPPPLFVGSNLLYDTVCGCSGGSDIYVVYDQDRAYPAYIISYHVLKNSTS